MNRTAAPLARQTRTADQRWCWFALVLVIAVHAGFSQPAPQVLGLAEAVIALGLVSLAGIVHPLALVTATAFRAVAVDRRHRVRNDGCSREDRVEGRVEDASHPMMTADRLAMAGFWLLLWLGALGAVVAGWPLGDITRDMVPLLFLFLPIIISPMVWRHLRVEYLMTLLCLAGGLLAWRYLVSTSLGPTDWGRFIHGQSLAYLANSPLIAGAAVFGVLQPLYRWVGVLDDALSDRRHGRIVRGLVSILLLLSAMMCWMAMASAGQRAPLLLSLVSVSAGLLWLGIGFGLRYPLTSTVQRRLTILLVAIVLVAGMVWALDALPAMLLADFTDKFLLVGDNARLAEWRVIIGLVGQEVLTLIFGLGWGAHYHSPAVGDYYVGYAHGMLPYLLLKTGLVGWVAIGLYGVAVVRWCQRGYRLRPRLTLIVLMAMMPPVVSAVLFYTSYKFLGLGLLLCAIRALGLASEQVVHDQQRQA